MILYFMHTYNFYHPEVPSCIPGDLYKLSVISCILSASDSKNGVDIRTRYNFTRMRALKDFGLGLGMLYQSSKIPWFTRSFQLPAYTTLDAALYYAPAASELQLALNVNNLTGTRYWLGAQNYLRLFPGAPANYLLTATYLF